MGDTCCARLFSDPSNGIGTPGPPRKLEVVVLLFQANFVGPKPNRRVEDWTSPFFFGVLFGKPKEPTPFGGENKKMKIDAPNRCI